MNKKITTKKMLLTVLLSLLAMIIAQLGAMIIAQLLFAFNISIFLCNAVAGILYILFAFLEAKIICNKFVVIYIVF